MVVSDNMRGFIDEKEIWYVDGMCESCEKIRVELLINDLREWVYMYKNELVMWILVIEVVQMMEWDLKQWEVNEWRKFVMESGM